jgi:hypothetical protein
MTGTWPPRANTLTGDGKTGACPRFGNLVAIPQQQRKGHGAASIATVAKIFIIMGLHHEKYAAADGRASA